MLFSWGKEQGGLLNEKVDADKGSNQVSVSSWSAAESSLTCRYLCNDETKHLV